ncbi:MAG: hypothetical protein ACRCZF_02200 [Gemmataceae bacterium]
MENKLIEKAIAAINIAIGTHGRKGGVYLGVTQAIGSLTAAELSILLQDDRTHQDFTPYLWAHHTTWAFESTWAYMAAHPPKTPQEAEDFAEMGDLPDDFDPNVPLNKVMLWAPQDHLSRVG